MIWVVAFGHGTTACADGDGVTDAIRGRLSILPSRFDYFLDEVQKVPNGRSRFGTMVFQAFFKGGLRPVKLYSGLGAKGSNSVGR
jgi:hypothetical protein